MDPKIPTIFVIAFFAGIFNFCSETSPNDEMMLDRHKGNYFGVLSTIPEAGHRFFDKDLLESNPPGEAQLIRERSLAFFLAELEGKAGYKWARNLHGRWKMSFARRKATGQSRTFSPGPPAGDRTG
jgi:hypothetical protein